MKKTILFIALLATTNCAKAQLYVSYTGTTTAKQITVNPADTTTNNGTLEAVRGQLGSSNYKYNIALSGYSAVNRTYNPFTKYAIGVKGQATYANGMNLGVYGVVIPPSGGLNLSNYLYLNYGAGIYGSNKSTIKSLSSTYAGYFDGIVGIYGNLTVSGTVNGVVISKGTSSASAKSSVLADESSTNVTNNLSGLRMSSFYFDQPEDMRVAVEPSGQKEDNLSYVLKNEDLQDASVMQVHSRKHFGLNADQLEEVYPDLVYENEDGTKSINYVEMVPILVQAINELQNQVNELKGGKGDVLMSKKATGIADAAESVELLSLGQNKPNPFSTATDIAVSVPATVQNAFVYVYDLQGKKVQQVDITARGRQTVKLNAADLAEGMYLYSLIADGKVVETRRMIIEK